MTRRDFFQKTTLISAGAMFLPSMGKSFELSDSVIMTVRGPLKPKDMGFTLTHEHIVLGVADDPKYVYDPEDVIKNTLPLLNGIKEKGCVTFIECTPSNIGRDVKTFQRLSEKTGLNILTNTGYYGAGSKKFLPPHTYTETAQQLANRWINEWKNGIDGTKIKPGFIKISVDNGPITKMQRKLVEAAAITHLATGLTIAVHTGDGIAANEQLEILKTYGASPSARIWVHAGENPQFDLIYAAAQQKSWISFDHVNPKTISLNIDFLQKMKTSNMLDYVLVSQDSGFYAVGKPNGGTIKPYTCIQDVFIPAMKENGFTQDEINKIFITNPARAFAIRIRKI